MSTASFYGFFGQLRTVGYLRRLINGAKHKGLSCPHVLLAGGSGLGKTALAAAMAAEYNTTFRIIQSNREFDGVDLADAAVEWLASDIILIDEAHALSVVVQELLFRVIDHGEVPVATPVEDRKARRIASFRKIPSITLVLATDQPGSLLPALKKRIPEIITLLPYGIKDLIAITMKIATELDLLLTAQSARLLAESARGTPRRIKHRLGSLRHFFADVTVSQFTVEHIREFLDSQGVDSHGLTADDRAYLRILWSRANEATSLQMLATRLRFDDAYIARDLEPWLFEQGLVEVAQSGRRLTEAGIALVPTLSPEDES